MNYKNYNDYEIMYMISENDEDALNILYRKYEPIVKSYAKKYMYTAKNFGIELDDLIQEGFLAIYNALRTYNVQHNTLFYTYVDFCIRGRMNNLLRLANGRASLVLNNAISLNEVTENGTEYLELISDQKAHLPYDFVLQNEINELVKVFMYGLKFDDANIFELKMNGFKNKEIAFLLEVDASSVSRRVYKLKENFKKFILTYRES